MKKDRNGKNGSAGAKAPAESERFILGKSRIFTPEVINDIHVKSELGRYRMRGFSLFKKIPHWDDLTFLPGTLTRFVIEGYREKCDTKTVIGPRAKRPMVLDIPVYVTGMSFGALSFEAKIALARGATMAGSATCSGEGGMIPAERRYSVKWFYQCIQSRYGFNPHHLRLADACEFFIRRHRSALAGAPSRLARPRRSRPQDRGGARGDQLGNSHPAQARRRARL
jgi:glutamate synthase domain-containing protein 2